MAEKRKAPVPRRTIGQILDAMQMDADFNHNGDVQGNILYYFNKLNIDDKRTFLRRAMALMWDTQVEFNKDGSHEVVIQVDKDVRIDRCSVNMERESIAEVNYEEQVKLKIWVQKVLFIMAMVSILFFVLFAFMTGNEDVVDGSIFGHVKNIFEVIF